MRRKTASGIMFSLLLIGMLILTFNIRLVKADWTWTETVYIRADGSVYPDTAPISTVDNITYTLTDNIVGDVPEDGYAIVVERDNIVIDGVGYTLQGTGVGIGGRPIGIGIYLFNRTNVTIKNMKIKSLYHGIYLWRSLNNIIYGNNIAEIDQFGIGLDNSSNNNVFGNCVTNSSEGIALWNAYCNAISGNDLANNAYGIAALATPSEEPKKLNNTIYGNNITNNTYGISLTSYHNNTIHENDINNNLHGISFISYCTNNTFYHNNFINNTLQVSFADSFSNVWDDGYPSGGNYWSDQYHGDCADHFSGPGQNISDSDGIVDDPYEIDVNNIDGYPLMKPWTPHQSPPVGGIYIPVNKLELLAPYIALTILLAVAVMTVGYVKKRKRHTDINS